MPMSMSNPPTRAGARRIFAASVRYFRSVATVAASSTRLDLYRQIARQLRADSIRSSTAAGSGHPTSSLSAADLMAVLLPGPPPLDWAEPPDPPDHHLPFSKGPGAPPPVPGVPP